MKEIKRGCREAPLRLEDNQFPFSWKKAEKITSGSYLRLQCSNVEAEHHNFVHKIMVSENRRSKSKLVIRAKGV